MTHNWPMLQTRAAVVMSLSEADRWLLVGHLDEHAVAELLAVMHQQSRTEFIEAITARDSSLALCADDALW